MPATWAVPAPDALTSQGADHIIHSFNSLQYLTLPVASKTLIEQSFMQGGIVVKLHVI
jgi:hypothetical protein